MGCFVSAWLSFYCFIFYFASRVKKGDCVLDLCCGSGDLAFLLSEKVGLEGKVGQLFIYLFWYLAHGLAGSNMDNPSSGSHCGCLAAIGIVC